MFKYNCYSPSVAAGGDRLGHTEGSGSCILTSPLVAKAKKGYGAVSILGVYTHLYESVSCLKGAIWCCNSWGERGGGVEKKLHPSLEEETLQPISASFFGEG